MRKNIMSKVNNGVIRVKIQVGKKVYCLREKLSETNGNFFEEALKYVIAFVLGALFLAIVYLILKETIGPSLKKQAEDLFNYSA